MKDGYYLSTYVHIDELSHLLGFHIRHDQNISLWFKEANRIKLIRHWELERLTGIKNQRMSFFNEEQAREVINNLLETYHLTLDDMVEIWGTPQLATCSDYHSVHDFPELSYHSVAHLFSALLLDSENFFNEDILGLAVDGGPDRVVEIQENYSGAQYYYTGCVSRKGKVETFPVLSPGILWIYALRTFGLREGTLMALATASKSEAYLPEPDFPILDDMNAFEIAPKYINKIIKAVFELTGQDQGKLFNFFDERFTLEENRISMVMKVIQNMSIRMMEKNIETICRKYSVDPKNTYLALAGGYALNCPTNSHLMQKYGFKGFLAPPCVSDTGLSIGMALYAFCKKMDTQFEFKLQHAYYGEDDLDVVSLIQSGKYRDFIKSINEIDYQQAVEDIKTGPVVWFNGNAEIGPRALGNRSILADPRRLESRDALNQIKGRQWWRPVAPVVPAEEVEEWFEESYASPFMLHTFKIKESKVNKVPAIAHLDNTARVQTINQDENPDLYQLIKCFKKETGVSIICNTSLNDKGEPIINRVEEAINFALRKNIKIAYLNGKRIEFQNHQQYRETRPLTRPVKFMKFEQDKERKKMLDEYNPHKVPLEIIYQRYYYPEFHKYNPQKKDEADCLVRLYKKMQVAMNPNMPA